MNAHSAMKHLQAVAGRSGTSGEYRARHRHLTISIAILLYQQKEYPLKLRSFLMKNVLSEFIPTESLMSVQGRVGWGKAAGTRALNAEGARLMSHHNSAARRRIAPQCFSHQFPPPDQWADQPIIGSHLIIDIYFLRDLFIYLLIHNLIIYFMFSIKRLYNNTFRRSL